MDWRLSATRGFCGKCGTPLYLQYDGDELIRVTVGSLDHPDQPGGTLRCGEPS
ncbi:GFA family protein [Rhizobium leguminosarum]|uniref:GFA family protein n=1 Tax=Rhizobium leguminosarum TaxID=384 RepID=UPI0021BBE3FF